MKKFGRKILSFALFVSLPVIVLMMVLPWLGIEPLLTDSMSYDLKMEYLADKQYDSLDLIAIGSSVALNNLHSETLLEQLDPETRFFNAASFGANMQNNLDMIQLLVPLYQPEAILLMSCHVDFEATKWQGLSRPDGQLFLDYRLRPYFYLRNFDLFRLAERKIQAEKYLDPQNSRTQHHMLMDEYGGVPLTVDKAHYVKERWERPLISEIDSSQYQVLADICHYLKQQEVELIFVQSPMKSKNCKTPECQEFQNNHISLTREIVEASGQQFIDMFHNYTYPDSMFCDEIHLNKSGPEIVTEALTNAIRDEVDSGFVLSLRD